MNLHELRVFTALALLGGLAFWPAACASNSPAFANVARPVHPVHASATLGQPDIESPAPTPGKGVEQFPQADSARSARSSSLSADKERDRLMVMANAQSVRSVPAPGRSLPAGKQGLRTLAATIATEERIDEPIFLALIADESSWNPRAVGKHGERGLLQLKAGTVRWCGKPFDRFDPEKNLRCGARYLRAQFDTFGSWELAVVGFKAGPNSIPDNIPARSWAYAQRTLRRAEAMR